LNTGQILDVLSDTLLATLAQIPDLTFVGHARDIRQLREFFSRSNGSYAHRYLCIDDPIRGWEPVLRDRTLIVLSFDDEAGLFDRVVGLLSMLGVQVRVLRLFADLFVNLMCGELLLKCSESPFHAPRLAYAIIGTPRCGSELLCEALRSLGEAGIPQEHLRSQSETITKYCHFDCVRYLRILMSRRITANGVFGTKLISHFLMEHLKSSPGLELLLSEFKFIYVVRDDLIDQAISAMLASKTNVWHVRTENERMDYLATLENLTITRYDVQRVVELSEAFARQSRYIAEFLKRHGIAPLVVKYEDLVADLTTQVLAIFSFLNIQTKVRSPLSVTVRSTHSKVSETVRAMYDASAGKVRIGE